MNCFPVMLLCFVSAATPTGTKLAISFSLRSCRSSSVNFLNIFRREILWGNLARILWDFSDPQNRGSKIRGKFQSIFGRKFVALPKSFMQNSLCRLSTLTFQSRRKLGRRNCRSLRNDNTISDNMFLHLQNCFVMTLPKKKNILGQFSFLPPGPTPSENANFIFTDSFRFAW